MARPTSKEDLVAAATADYDKLMTMIETMTPDQRIGNFTFDPKAAGKEAHWQRDKNLRDVLIHLYEWHNLLLNWVNTNQEGTPTPFLPAPYNWRNYKAMNEGFWANHQQTSLEDATESFKKSHHAVMTMIDTLTGNDLFSKAALPWTGGSTLGQYCVSATTSHYKWAQKKLRRHIKTSTPS